MLVNNENMIVQVKYPPVRTGESRYLNSGGYMGYADSIYKLLTDHEIADADDDQLYFTNLFIDEYQLQVSCTVFTSCLNHFLAKAM